MLKAENINLQNSCFVCKQFAHVWPMTLQSASTAAASGEPSVPNWSGEALDDNSVDNTHLIEMLKKADNARRMADEQVAGLKLKELNLKMELEVSIVIEHTKYCYVSAFPDQCEVR